MGKRKPKSAIIGRWIIVSMTSGIGNSSTRKSAVLRVRGQGLGDRSSSATSRARWTTGLTERDGKPAVEFSSRAAHDEDGGCSGPWLDGRSTATTLDRDVLLPSRRRFGASSSSRCP